VALTGSENRFIIDLIQYYETNRDLTLKGKELYIIRNMAKTGIGFFETAGFYPDFILWILDENVQHIVFIEPHGIIFEDLSSEKIKLHITIKEQESKMALLGGKQKITLDSFIVTPTKYGNLKNNVTENAYNLEGVYFMDDADYLKKIIESVITT
jgi:hypothetical protein